MGKQSPYLDSVEPRRDPVPRVEWAGLEARRNDECGGGPSDAGMASVLPVFGGMGTGRLGFVCLPPGQMDGFPSPPLFPSASNALPA